MAKMTPEEEQKKKSQPGQPTPPQTISTQKRQATLSPGAVPQPPRQQNATMQPSTGIPMLQNAPQGSVQPQMMQGKQGAPGQIPAQEPRTVTKVGPEEIRKATTILKKYKDGKSNLESRIISSENWWKLRHWDEMEGGNAYDKKPVSAWLFNVIMGKQADAIEAYPEPNILPREDGDKGEAEKLSSILPVVLEHNGFEGTYSDCSWQKMKSGTAIYGVFWDKSKLNGLGDITIRKADALNLFWKPGITDIESSPHLFAVEAVDNDDLIMRYPELDGKLKGCTLTVSKYIYDDHVDTTETSIVIDWYYKKSINGKTVLHYCKYVGENVIYASENIPELLERGYYDDGEYPYVFDPLFPIEGSPCGYGYIDICKSPQESIDILNQAIVKNAVMGSTPRYFVRQDGAVNETEFADWTKPLVHVSGNLAVDTLKPVEMKTLDSTYVAILNNKIEELKQTSGNQDVQNGATGGGVTAASAIAALQESAGRSSKASTKSAYRAYSKLINKCIERIRQFYDMPRQFRIVGERGAEKYISYSNAAIQPQNQGVFNGVDMGLRLPVFDVSVRPQKANPYSKLSQNELALQLYGQGFFNPQAVDQALVTLDMMEFDGKDEIIQKISMNGTLQQKLIMYQQMAIMLAAKYEPQMAAGLAQDATGAMASRQSAGGKPELSETPQENKIVSNARTKAATASQPN